MWIYGAGGHGKVILDCLEKLGINVEGFIDDDSEKAWFENYPIIASNKMSMIASEIIIGIGNNENRAKVANKVPECSLTIVHPSAIVSPRAALGNGTVILHNSVVQTGAKVGKYCISNTRSSIGHDCILGDFVHVASGAILCGNVTIGDLTWVGAGATIIQGLTIGRRVIIGAGAVVIRDVPDNVVVVGNPSRLIRKI
jgi:sugar O-acyltransferase (sialic acid O-acetyltransferase NeuD family)